MTSRLLRTALVALTACALNAGHAMANARYTYTGQNYTYMYPSNGCLTTGMHLSMKILLADKLAPNLANQSVTAISWVIDDGLHMFKDTQAKAVVPLRAQFSTDADGHITDWSIDSYYYAKDGFTILYTTHSNSSGDYSADYKCNPSSVGSNFVTGTWKPK